MLAGTMTAATNTPSAAADATRFRSELARKGIHLASALIPIAYALWLPRPVMLNALGGCLALMFLIEILRSISPAFRDLFQQRAGFMLRSFEQQRLTGASYVLIAGFLAVLLFPKDVAIAVLVILSVSDSCASLVGMKFGGPRWAGKSLGGCLAFFLSALVILLVVLRAPWPICVLGALVGMIVEALPLQLGSYRIDDNLSVPLLTGLVITAIQSSGWF